MPRTHIKELPWVRGRVLGVSGVLALGTISPRSVLTPGNPLTVRYASSWAPPPRHMCAMQRKTGLLAYLGRRPA